MRNKSLHPIKPSYLASLLHQLGKLKNGLGCNDIKSLLIAQVGNHHRFNSRQFWEEFYACAKRLNYSFNKIVMDYTIAKAVEVEKDGIKEITKVPLIGGKRSFITSEEAEAFNERLATVKMKLSFRSAGEKYKGFKSAYANRSVVNIVGRKNLFSLSIQVSHSI